MAKELRSRCLKEQVPCEKTPKQCKDKLVNLTKKYKTVKDKLRSTGFGKGGEPDEDADINELSDPKEFITQNVYDLDEVFGGRESVDPQHVLESSDVTLNQDEVEKIALDNEIFEATKKVRSEASSGTSNIPRSQSPNSDSDDDDIAFSRSLFLQSKSSSGVKRKKAAPKCAKANNKCKKGKGASKDSAEDETNATLSFLKQSQEKDEQFMAKMMEMEQEARETQQNFSLEALSMLGNILKDIAKTKE